MGQQTLSYEQGEQYYRIRDALAVYAYEQHTEIEGELFYDGLPGHNNFVDETLRETLAAAWSDPDLIDEFADRNPFHLPNADLDIVRSWKCAYADHFIIVAGDDPDAGPLFLGDGVLFDVSGLSQPIVEVIGCPLPTYADTTLLPFGDLIVYDSFISTYPIAIGEGMVGFIDDTCAKLLAEGTIVASGERLVELSPELERKREQREMDAFKRDIEQIEASTAPIPGTHRGVLAGLSEEERARLVDGRIEGTLRDMLDVPHLVTLDAHRGKPRRDLREMLGAARKDELRSIAWGLDIPDMYNLKKDELADAMARVLPESGREVEALLTGYEEGDIQQVRRVVEAGGALEVRAADVQRVRDVPPPIAGICQGFVSRDIVTYVVADEMMPLMRGFDWDVIERNSRVIGSILDIAGAVVALRGIVPIGDAWAEFERAYPGESDMLEFTQSVVSAVQSGEGDFCIVDDGQEVYLVAFEVAEVFRREHGMSTRYYTSAYLAGDLGTLDNLLAFQEGIPPRPLSPEMRREVDVFDYRAGSPSAIAMRNWLDAHVPDDKDDLYFADRVIEELVDHLAMGVDATQSLPYFLDFLADHGLEVDKAHAPEVVELLVNLVNATPSYTNNGWSPDELMLRRGMRVVEGGGGRTEKVGRNDPCPCGSGKKYKHCHGRPGRKI